MKNGFLLPHKFKKIGWLLFIPAGLLGILLTLSNFGGFEIESPVFAIYSDQLMGETHFFSFVRVNLIYTLAGVLVIVGGLIVGFSKEKVEDEFISKLRLSSLLWAVLVNYLLLLFAFLFVYGISFVYIIVYNMFTVLLLFILRFHFVLYRTKAIVIDEKPD